MRDDIEQVRFEQYQDWLRIRQDALTEPIGTVAVAAITGGLLFPGRTEHEPAAFEPTEKQRRFLGQKPLALTMTADFPLDRAELVERSMFNTTAQSYAN